MRIQIEVDESGARVLDQIKKSTGLNTYKDIFDNGLTLLLWAVRQRTEGRVIAALDEQSKNYKELQMPALEEAARRSKAPAAAV